MFGNCDDCGNPMPEPAEADALLWSPNTCLFCGNMQDYTLEDKVNFLLLREAEREP